MERLPRMVRMEEQGVGQESGHVANGPSVQEADTPSCLNSIT